MERWLQFMSAHPILFGIMAMLIVAFFMLENHRSGRKVSPQALGGLMQRENAVVIDLRDSKDFKEGHISGSRNIPFSRLNDHLAELRESGQPMVFVCNMGQVAGNAAQSLGTPNCYRLDGGIMNWKSSGLPLVKTGAKRSAA